MTESETAPASLPPGAEAQRSIEDLTVRVAQLEAEKHALETETKALKQQIEKLIVHRQASHNELVLLLTSLVSKLPLNDVGVIVARLVEHNTNVNHYLASLAKGTAEVEMEAPSVLKSYDQTKRDLSAAIKPLVEEVLALGVPIEKEMIECLATDPKLFFSPKVVRAARCFFKGQVPRERIVRQYGNEALAFFNDLTTDPKLNPRPKPDEIVLAFRNDAEQLLEQDRALAPEKRADVVSLHKAVQASKSNNAAARQQKNAFLRLSFIIELLHYYEHQSTENPETIFAHRLPALVEQLVITGPNEPLDEQLIKQAESLIAHVVNPDHRQMILNNLGKTGDQGKTLKFVMKLRHEKVPELDQVIADFVRHLIPAPPERPPRPEALTPILKLILPDMQIYVLRTLMTTDRMRRTEGEALAKAIAAELGHKALLEAPAKEAASPEAERQLAWSKIKDLIARRTEPSKVADAIRERLHAKYDADEVRQSWVTLTEADPMSLIRIFCHLPYGSNGKTDPIARPVMETYVSRLMHEKYANTYMKVVRSLKNMFAAKADSPTLLNFTALVRWVDPEVANRLQSDIGMPVPA